MCVHTRSTLAVATASCPNTSTTGPLVVARSSRMEAAQADPIASPQNWSVSKSASLVLVCPELGSFKSFLANLKKET